MPKLRRILAGCNAIVESNSVLRFLKPDLCLMVVDGLVADFKPSSLRFLDRADALVVTSAAPLAWPAVAASLLTERTRFAAPAPEYENPSLIARIREVATRHRSLTVAAR